MWKRWERGKHEPDDFYKKIIASVFGTSVESLFDSIPPHLLATEGGSQTLATDTRSDVVEHEQGNTFYRLEDVPYQYTALPSDETIVVPCQTSAGRIVFMALPRRVFLGSLGLGSIAVLTPNLPTPSRSTMSPPLPPGVDPIEHFRQLRRVLIDNDNLLGPLQVIPTVERQIEAIRRFRRDQRGADARNMLYIQTQYAEFCGWLYQDVGDFRSAQYWTDRALEWAHATNNTDITTYILARKSQLAGDMRDVLNSIDLAQVGATHAPPNSRLAAITLTFGAYGYALSGQLSESQRMFDHAREVLTRLDEDPKSPWGPWLDESYIEVHRARGLLALGDHAKAADGFHDAIEQLPPEYHRDRGVYLARESLAHSGAQEPEQAASVGMQALAVAELTGSARIVNELITLDSQLAGWKRVSDVADFREAFRELVPPRITPSRS